MGIYKTQDSYIYPCHLYIVRTQLAEIRKIKRLQVWNKEYTTVTGISNMLLRISLTYDVSFVFSLLVFCRRFIFYWCLLYLFSTAFPYQMMFVSFNSKTPEAGAYLGFQVRGGALNKIAPSGRRRENLWDISCAKSYFRPWDVTSFTGTADLCIWVHQGFCCLIIIFLCSVLYVNVREYRIGNQK